MRLSAPPRRRPRARSELPGLTIVIDHLAQAAASGRRDGTVGGRVARRSCAPERRAKISGLNTIFAHGDWGADDLRDAVAVAVDAFGPDRLVCGSDWPVALLNGSYEQVWRETLRVVDDVAPDARRASARQAPPCASTGWTARRVTGSGRAWPRSPTRRSPKIKDLIMSGEFIGGLEAAEGAGSRAAPRPLAQLAARGGARADADRRARAARRRRHLRDEPRAGAAPDRHGLHQRPADGSTLLELHQVRRILEPVATGMAATRLDEADFAALERCLADMDAAETTQAFIAADDEFHRIIVAASGNATLASLIQNLSGGTLRARLWRSVIERGRDRDHEAAPLGHLQRAARPRRRAGGAADLIHLSEGEQWLRQLIQAEEALTVLATEPPDTDPSGNGDENAGSTQVTAACYVGDRTVDAARNRAATSPARGGRARCRLHRHLRHGSPHRARRDGRAGLAADCARTRDVRLDRRGRGRRDRVVGRRSRHRHAAGLVRQLPSLPRGPYARLPQPELPRHRLAGVDAGALGRSRRSARRAASGSPARAAARWSSRPPWRCTMSGERPSGRARRPSSSAAGRSACSSRALRERPERTCSFSS